MSASERLLDDRGVALAVEAAEVVVEQHVPLAQRFRAAHSLAVIAVGRSAPPEQRWTFLAILAGMIGQVLRPSGHPGGPIGPAEASTDRIDVIGDPTDRDQDHRALWLASVLIGAGATRDAELCGDLADVVCNGDNPSGTAQRVARAMLETLIELPIEEAPQENP